MWQILTSLWTFSEGTRNYLKAIWLLFSSVAVLMATLGSLLWPFLASAEGIENIALWIDALSGTLAGMPIGPWLAMLNRFFPVSEALSLLAILFSLKVAAMLLRWVRSFLPTIGG